MKYNANGGQRRSRKVKLAIPSGINGFAQFMVSLVEIKNKHGKDIALACLNKYVEKYKIEGDEVEFLRGLLK